MRRTRPILLAALFAVPAIAVPVGCASDTSAPTMMADGKAKATPSGTASSTPRDSYTASKDEDREAEETVSATKAPEAKPVTKTANANPPPPPAAAPIARNVAQTTSGLASGGETRSGALAGPAGDRLSNRARREPMEKKKTKERRMAPKVVMADKTLADDSGVEKTPSAGGTFVHAGTNPFVDTLEDKKSTFAIDVDTASYTYARRFLKVGNVPPAGSVRVEEWINAFHYEYEGPDGDVPFAAHMEAGPSPFHADRHLVRIGIQGKRLTNEERKPVHLTFLVDVSGSMSRADKLPLAQKALTTLVNNLRRDDSVAIVTYAGRTAEILATTKVSEKDKIIAAINNMKSGGGTNMGSAMEIAYRNANKHLGDGRMARVVVLSDGDANIGRTSHRDILKAVKGYVSEGVTLSTVGFGTGNYRDHLMEQLADAGNGNYSYIDSPAAAQKVFGDDLVGTLQVIAKDVKIQVEFNSDVVARYRLLGYENRDIADKDFRNDKVDAGEIGAGHSVTAIYEVELAKNAPKADIATVRVRYKQPRGTRASEVTHALTSAHMQSRFGALSADTRFATALAVASEVLRGSPYAEGLNLDDARALAVEALTGEYKTERRAFVELLSSAHRGSALSRR